MSKFRISHTRNVDNVCSYNIAIVHLSTGFIAVTINHCHVSSTWPLSIVNCIIKPIVTDLNKHYHHHFQTLISGTDFSDFLSSSSFSSSDQCRALKSLRVGKLARQHSNFAAYSLAAANKLNARLSHKLEARISCLCCLRKAAIKWYRSACSVDQVRFPHIYL